MKLSIAIVMMSATRERLQMAAMVAAVGAVSGNAVRVFVSMNALPFFVKGERRFALAEGAAGPLLERSEPPFQQLLADAAELGDTLVFPCSLAMELFGVRHDQLDDYFGPPVGLTRFMEEAAGSQVWCL